MKGLGRRLPIEQRKHTLGRLAGEPNQASWSNGDVVYQQVCKRGCEGIVSKRLGSPYRPGRSKHWLKNPAAPAVRRRGKENGVERGLPAVTHK
jgi:hypothetical protein